MSCKVVKSIDLFIHAGGSLFISAHVVKLFIEITIGNILSVDSGKTRLSIVVIGDKTNTKATLKIKPKQHL